MDEEIKALRAKYKTLTDRERAVLERIDVVREQNTRRLKESYPEGTPTEWVIVDTLVRVHHVPRQAINGLIRKGYLEERPSGGWGQEVRRASP